MWRSKRPMRKTIATLAIITSLALPVAAASQSNWDLLGAIKITETETNGVWRANKEFPAALKNATNGFQVEGYYIPIQAQPYVQSFLLVQDPADCPFCGGGGYGPALEVTLKKPMYDMAEFSLITVRGELELISDPETFMAYRLVDGRVINN